MALTVFIGKGVILLDGDANWSAVKNTIDVIRKTVTQWKRPL